MIVLCAWHKNRYSPKRLLGIKRPLLKLAVSHGICKECLEKERHDAKDK